MSVDRAEALARAVAERELDGLIVGDLVRPGDSTPDARANLFWLTGFTGTSGLAVIGADTRLFLTDFRYTELAERQVDGSFERVTAERLMRDLAARLHGRVGFDDEATSVANLDKLREALEEAGSRAELVVARGMVEQLRGRKDEHEQRAIAEAARLTDEVYEAVLTDGIVGRSELAVARAAEEAMRERGAEPSFPAIVAAGPNGALPHAVPSERRIGSGELVVWDMGAQLDGYCSDCTRTFATGEIEDEAREAYELVLRAQLAGLEAVRAGVTGQDADAAARTLIEEAGKGDLFGHGLGHGVGIEVHEAPRLGSRSEDVLAAGNVVSVEPGIYVPGRYGVRIEDLVVVTEGEPRILTSLSKELRVVG